MPRRGFKKKAYSVLNAQEWQEIKDALLRGVARKEIEEQTGRTHGTITLIEKTDSFEHYRTEMSRINNEYKARREARRAGVEPTPIALNQTPTNLEQALSLLEDSFGVLKTNIALVVETAVEEKMAEEREAMKAELVSLRTVVDAAKRNNLATTLKERLLGKK